MNITSWRTLIVMGVLSAAVPGTNNSTMANTVQSPSLRTLLKDARSGPRDLREVLVDLAIQSIPDAGKKKPARNQKSEKFSVPAPAHALSRKQMRRYGQGGPVPRRENLRRRHLLGHPHRGPLRTLPDSGLVWAGAVLC